MAIQAELVGITGQNRISYIQDHRVDVLPSVGECPERKKMVVFTAIYASCCIATPGLHGLAILDIAALTDKPIAVNRGTLADIAVADAAPKSADIKRFDNDNGVIAVSRIHHP